MSITVGGLEASYQVRLMPYRSRWWWFIVSRTDPDPTCRRGDAATEEMALQMALYEANKLTRDQ